ncbi:multidrug effflux MFS transporter [Hellea sp.]|nr:multidrug effflux MFS transporter [Hellea sp.]
MNTPQENTTGVKLTIPLWEFVAMMAGLLALNALAIDTMLPALGEIGQFFNVHTENDQQMVVFAYIFGFGFPQLVFGPLSDRYGRKGLLQICLVGFTIAGLACMFAQTFFALLLFRFTQGIFAAGFRVIATSIIRDLTSGRAMASILSLVFTVFMIVPIIAPAIGTAVMTFADWHWTFGVLAVSGMVMLIWTFFRLPATLPVEKRQPLNLGHITRSYKTVLTTRVAIGYMFASGIVFGALFSFIGASEQIFSEVFERGDMLWFWFAVVASGLGVASLINSRIVQRLGMRRISHTVLLLFIGFSALNLVAMRITDQNFWVFIPLFTLGFACFGMMGANFSSLALEPLGKIAGYAAAVYGTATTTISSFIGFAIARQFNGTVYPLLLGFVAMGLISLSIVLITERGKLFELGEGKN